MAHLKMDLFETDGDSLLESIIFRLHVSFLAVSLDVFFDNFQFPKYIVSLSLL